VILGNFGASVSIILSCDVNTGDFEPLSAGLRTKNAAYEPQYISIRFCVSLAAGVLKRIAVF
jgi:hypothetical protein